MKRQQLRLLTLRDKINNINLTQISNNSNQQINNNNSQILDNFKQQILKDAIDNNINILNDIINNKTNILNGTIDNKVDILNNIIDNKVDILNNIINNKVDIINDIINNKVDILNNIINNILPVGTIIQHANNIPIDGWLVCDGSSLLINDYKLLYDMIGTTYNLIESNEKQSFTNETFNLPNFGGRVALGCNNKYVIGKIGGEESHVLLTSEIPSHTHTTNNSGYGLLRMSEPDEINTSGSNLNAVTGEPDLHTSPQSVVINNTGGNQAHNIMQPYLVVNYLIKYK